MEIILAIGFLLFAYLLGSIPFGLLLVRLRTGKDIRQIESGRTGGTNAMRAAGFWMGFWTASLDALKAACTVWIARAVFPSEVYPWSIWVEVLAPIMAILGHNHSIFLIERNEQGKLRLRGGAGGAPTAGGLLGLWPPAFIIATAVGLSLLYWVGYASLATLSVPLVATGIFAVGAAMGKFPWQYILYGILAELLLAWALRPNIRRLLNGTERVVGFRARRQKKQTMPGRSVKQPNNSHT